jgi:hypothetical protein
MVLDPAEYTSLTDLATKYLNLLTKIDFQNERIVELVEDLVAQRALGAAGARGVNLAKLDISDRKARRFFLERDRVECAAPLSRLINTVQLTQLTNGARQAADTAVPTAAPGKAGRITTARRRRVPVRQFTDAELVALLKDPR